MEFQIAPNQPQYTGMKYAGLSPAECEALNRPPERPPMPPLPPRRLPKSEIQSRLGDTEKAIARLERALERGNDCKLLFDEVRGNLQLLSGELRGTLADIESGRLDAPAHYAPDAAQLRKARRLLLNLCVPDSGFLDPAKAVLATLRTWWPKNGFPDRPGLPVPENAES